jgi:hypothetical protein
MFSELNKAGLLSAPASLIAVSFLQLFLGGLLPSRARFRFAGAETLHPQSNLLQSRGRQSVSPFNCLSHGVQSKLLSPYSISRLR